MDNFGIVLTVLNLRAAAGEELDWYDARKELLAAHNKDMQTFLQPLVATTTVNYYVLEVQVRTFADDQKFIFAQHCKKLKPLAQLCSDFETTVDIEVDEYEILAITTIPVEDYLTLFGCEPLL